MARAIKVQSVVMPESSQKDPLLWLANIKKWPSDFHKIGALEREMNKFNNRMLDLELEAFYGIRLLF